MARLVGVVSHLTYWQVFGHLNPVQPDLITKKQMILISMEQLNLLRKKVKVRIFLNEEVFLMQKNRILNCGHCLCYQCFF